jgi:hypothetical protein
LLLNGAQRHANSFNPFSELSARLHKDALA